MAKLKFIPFSTYTPPHAHADYVARSNKYKVCFVYHLNLIGGGYYASVIDGNGVRICYNNFATKEQAIEWLNEQKKIIKKYSQNAT